MGVVVVGDLQDLPSDVKAACEHADSKYNVGWSHGKEALRNGHRDTHKGSFYANPLQVRYGAVHGSTRLGLPYAWCATVHCKQSHGQLHCVGYSCVVWATPAQQSNAQLGMVSFV